MINLGDKVKDTITGYEGIAVARTCWLNGCVRISIQSTKLKDGIPVVNQDFDEVQVKFIEANAVPASSQHPAGPKQSPTRNSTSG